MIDTKNPTIGLKKQRLSKKNIDRHLPTQILKLTKMVNLFTKQLDKVGN